MNEADYKSMPKINDTCAGCAFDWIRSSVCVGPCPDWAWPRCAEDEIRWVEIKEKQ